MRAPTRPGLPGITAALVAATTTWLALFAWRGFTTAPADFLAPLAVLAALTVGTGIVARGVRLPGWLVLGLQSFVLVAFISAHLGGSPVPGPGTLRSVVEALNVSVETAQRFAAPVPADAPGIHPVLILGGGLCLLLVDVLVATLRRAPLAGLPLLTIHTVGVSVLAGVAWWIYAVGAVGFCLLLLLGQAEERSHWGPTVRPDPGEARWQGAATAGVVAAAVGIGLAAPALVPTYDLDLIGFGRGAGGGESVSLENPITDLRRDLQRGADIPLVQVRTTEPNPGYLRTSVLNRFSGNTWSPGDRQVPADQTARGEMPPLHGARPRLQRTEYTWGIAVTGEFRSTWLPTPSPISRINAAGGWRYDVDTMDFMAHEEGLDTADLRYSATAVRLDLDAAAMAEAPSGSSAVGPEMTDLPDDLPEMVPQLAEEVVDPSASDFEQAVALQRWFREAGGFTYSLETAAGSGSDELVSFLQDRVGYCEQFSAAMAVMARSLGIPARVAVGFLRPEQVGPQLYEFSSHDLHAWPELYISGAGWVAFEPTPADRAADVPGYTTQRIPENRAPDTPDSVPTEQAPAPDPGAAPELPEERDEPTASESDSRTPWPALVLVVLLIGVTGLGLLVPRAVRDARRRTRWAEPSVSDGWAELRDSVVDHAITWPPGLSPRATAQVLAENFAAPSEYDDPVRPERGPHTNPGAMRALERLVDLRERALYARGPVEVDAEALRADVERAVAGLRSGTSRRVRRRADWWPASALRRQVVERSAHGDRDLDHLDREEVG